MVLKKEGYTRLLTGSQGFSDDTAPRGAVSSRKKGYIKLLKGSQGFNDDTAPAPRGTVSSRNNKAI